MSDRLVVTEENELKEVSIPERIEHPAWMKVLARIISVVFHPLFVPVYLTYFILEIHSYQFAGIDPWIKTLKLLLIGITCCFMPLMSILLLKGLNFIDSIFLKTQKERIAPYIICMTFYFSTWYFFKKQHEVGDLVSMTMAIFNASVFGFITNIFLKVSMHAIAVGVMSTFMALLAYTDSANLSLYLSVAVIIAGLVCTARLIVSDHTQKEIYLGFFIGVFSQLAAHYFVYA